MKKIILLLTISFSLFLINTSTAQVGVGIPATSIHPSAELDVTSNTKGFLPPRMTYAQRNAIVNPAAGLIVYCTDCNAGVGEMNYFNGIKWVNMANGTASTNLANLPSISICNQEWMKRNLDVVTYANGDTIPEVTDQAAWDTLTTGAWCYYNNNPSLGNTYGKLYNWYAVNDPRGLAPAGWHVPTKNDWSNLMLCIDQNADTASVSFPSDIINHALRAFNGWISVPSSCQTDNHTDFSALPGGNRTNGFFGDGDQCYMWTITEFDNASSYIFNIDFCSFITRRPNSKNTGLSVRCLKD